MRTMFYLSIAIFFIAVFSYFAYEYWLKNGVVPEYATTEVGINGSVYKLDIADSPVFRQKGLMYVESMNEDRGMLFIFDKEGVYPFWMKNTLISLDIIWLSAEGKVVYIKENAKPCSNVVEAVCKSISPVPGEKAMYVIELNAGEVANLGLQVGDLVPLEL